MKQGETRININKAELEDLERMPGVDGTRAKYILKYRKEHGEFKSWEDLDNIPGIDDKLKEVIRRGAVLQD